MIRILQHNPPHRPYRGIPRNPKFSSDTLMPCEFTLLALLQYFAACSKEEAENVICNRIPQEVNGRYDFSFRVCAVFREAIQRVRQYPHYDFMTDEQVYNELFLLMNALKEPYQTYQNIHYPGVQGYQNAIKPPRIVWGDHVLYRVCSFAVRQMRFFPRYLHISSVIVSILSLIQNDAEHMWNWDFSAIVRDYRRCLDQDDCQLRFENWYPACLDFAESIITTTSPSNLINLDSESETQSTTDYVSADLPALPSNLQKLVATIIPEQEWKALAIRTQLNISQKKFQLEFLRPALEQGIIKATRTAPRDPRQSYLLTAKGIEYHKIYGRTPVRTISQTA